MLAESKYELKKNELFLEISELIQRDGIESLTVRKICKELNISTGSFYHYFPEKGDISRIMFSAIDRYFETEVVHLFTEDETFNLILFAESYGAFAVSNGVDISRNISMAPLKYYDKNYLTEDRIIFKILYDILDRGLDNDEFNFEMSTLEMTRMLMVLLRGYCSDWAKVNGHYDLVEKIGIFIRLFIKSIK